MATCLDCIAAAPKSEKKGPCFCKMTPNKIKRSTSLKESPQKNRKSSFSFSEKRSLSMSSLHRSRSVQKLDFSMDMSVDGSFHNQSQGEDIHFTIDFPAGLYDTSIAVDLNLCNAQYVSVN